MSQHRTSSILSELEANSDMSIPDKISPIPTPILELPSMQVAKTSPSYIIVPDPFKIIIQSKS